MVWAITSGDINTLNNIVNIIDIENDIYKEISIGLINNIAFLNRTHIVNSIFNQCDSFIPEIANNNCIINDESIIRDYINLVDFMNNKDNENIQNKLIHQFHILHHQNHIAFLNDKTKTINEK